MSSPAKKIAPAQTGTSTATPQPPSKKRKMDAAEQKYYAVRAGFKPGVYTSWAICRQQITGFKGAQCRSLADVPDNTPGPFLLTPCVVKSFLNYEDASSFAAGRDPPPSKDDNKPIRYYGVAVGRKPGVYTDWSAVQEAIVGWKGPKYRKFETRADADAFVRSYSGPAGTSKTPEVHGDEDNEVEVLQAPPAKRKRTATKGQISRSPVLVVYTDGSSRGNGRVGAVAGVGVYFGDNDPRFVDIPHINTRFLWFRSEAPT